METLAFRRARAAAIGVLFVLASVSTARADDVVQIEKATKLEREAEDWLAYNCFEKMTGILAEADKALVGVDETGKAEIVARMKECRDRIAEFQKNWTAEQFKSVFERTLSSSESGAQHSDADVGAYERPQAMLDDGWIKSHADAALRTELQKKLDWSKKKVTSEANRADAHVFNGFINQLFEGIEHHSENASRGWDISQERFDDYSKQIEAKLDSDQGKKLLTADEIAGYRKRLEKARADLVAATADNHIAQTQEYVTKVQDMLDHPEKVHYWSDVEAQIGYAEKSLPRCPADDPRTKKLEATIAEQRKTLASKQSATEHDETVNPAIKYWGQIKEQNMKNAEGWEQETTATTLADFLHHSSLGCDKTLHLLTNVVGVWLDNDMVKKAEEKYPNDPELKKTYDEVEALRDTAEAKVSKCAGSILGEAEKLPEGKDRESFKSHLYNLKNEVSRATGGGARRKNAGTPDAGGAALVARIEALEKKWSGDKAASEGAKKELDKKLVDAANAVWPNILGAFKTKKLDAPDALAHNSAWQGTYVHIRGGARGVDLNRSGWDYEDQFYFIVDMDGIPVAGNLDSGLEEAFAKVEAQTGIKRDNEEELVGVIDGTCKVWTLFHYSNGGKSVRDRQVDAVRMRIVALKSVTVAAGCGQGTNLQKLSEFKEVSVSESGSSGSGGGRHSGGGGGFFHMIHRFLAWGACLLLAIAGLAAIGHGASKFVPQIQEQKVKLGDYLGYGGVVFGTFGLIWFGAAIVGRVLGFCELGSLPSVALVLAGAAIGIDLARSKGKLKEETASMIQPVAILFGVGCLGAAAVHFFFWDWMLL